MTIIRIITATALALLPTVAFAADSAADIVKETADKISSTPSIKASYTLTSPGHGSVSGNVTLAGEKFVMISPQMSTWYNGTTQWTYVPADKEVTVSEPTAEELPQINPFVILNNFTHAFTPVLMKSTAGERRIKLSAKSKKSDISSAILSIDSATKLPRSATLTFSDGRAITVTLSNVTTGKRLQSSHFTFDKKRYPGVEIIDLR